jgi:hypothetical protein
LTAGHTCGAVLNTIAVDWYVYLEETIGAERANRAWLRRLRTGSYQNRPLA